MANENSWRTKAYRQDITAKLEVAVRKSGCNIQCADQENQFFLKAKSKKEYLCLVSAFISHLNSIDDLEKIIHQNHSFCQQFSATTIKNITTDDSVLVDKSLITYKQQIQNLAVNCGASDEQTYQKEIRDLNKYIEPLKKVTAKLGIEDFIQLSDVLRIISKPPHRCLDIIKKCKGILDSFFAKKGIEVIGNLPQIPEERMEVVGEPKAGGRSSSQDDSNDTDAELQESDNGDKTESDTKCTPKGDVDSNINWTPKSSLVSKHAITGNDERNSSMDYSPSQHVLPNDDKAKMNTNVKNRPTFESKSKPLSTFELTESQARIWLKSDLFSPQQQSECTSMKSPDAKKQTHTSQPSGLPAQHTSNIINSTKEAKEMQQLVTHQPMVSNATVDEVRPSTSQGEVNGRHERHTAMAKNHIWKVVVPSTSYTESDGVLSPLRFNFTLKRLRRYKKAYTSEQLKRLYFMKKIEIAQFELHSKKVLHKLECSIKRRQLEKLC